MSNILKGLNSINEASDISGLLAASRLNRSFIITAKTYEGPTKKFRVKAQSKNIAKEKFKRHYSMANILDIEEESKDDSHWNFGSGMVAEQGVAEGQIYSGGNKEAGVRWYEPRHVPNQDELDENLRTDNPCWKGYHPVGTKKKNGKTVPNCVPLKKESAIMKGLQTEGNDEEFHTGGGKGLPFPGTYEQETLPYRTKGQKRTQAIAFEDK